MTPRGALRARSYAAPVAPNAYPAVVATIAGFAMVIGSWIAVSDQPAFGSQVGYFNVAVGGLVIIAGGAATYLVEFRRQLRRRILLVTNAGAR